MSFTFTRMARRAAMFVAALIGVAVIWEAYKFVGPTDGGSVLGVRILPRTADFAMPHVWEMFQRFGRPEERGRDGTVFAAVAAGAWYSFRLAAVGFVLGGVVGVGLAVVMARFDVVRRGLLPYLVVSQTVPLIALAPLVVSWGGRLEIGSFTWPRWLSASVLGAFLAFFPVAVGTLRGLAAAPPAALELMQSYAASWWRTLLTLRFPTAVPYMVPAFRLAASSAVIGVVVAEISTGLKGGIGRLIIEYAREATGDPAKVYTAIFGAAALGLTMAGIVAVTDTAGEFVSLIGPSGCGKSTLLRLVAHLLEPTTGNVTVNGKSAAQARLDQDYGMAFQQAGLFEWRTVRKNIELPLELKGWDKARRRERAEEMLALVQLPEFGDHYPWQLSGGMQQRIAIARALAAHPQLLLMDEPFGALDEMTREYMQGELLRICAETKTTVLFVTHSIPEAVYLSQRVVVMSPRPGRITKIVDVGLTGPRSEDTRNAESFFRAITAVREGLRGMHAEHVAMGMDDR